jgi:ribonuclease T1
LGDRQRIARSVKTAAAAVSLVASLWMPGVSWARAPLPESVAERTILALEQLPAEAQRTHRLIHSGGPFPYRKDGSVFGNRERLLPVQSRGFYREYTVPTPGARDRGARRIVCGGPRPRAPSACFYSSDHYASFGRIAQ